MILQVMLLALATGFQEGAGHWVPYTSQDGNFVIDFPGKPTKSFSRQSRSRTGTVKVVVVQCDTPNVLYVAEKIELPQATGLKPAEAESLLDYWRDDCANDFNGKVVTQKKIRLDSGPVGRDFTIEGRPDTKGGLSTVRVREYLGPKVLYMIQAVTAPDKELPEDVGHFFASFSVGTNRMKKVGPHPEATGKPLGDWGIAIDPDGDCKIDDNGDVLEISIPNTHHNLNADQDKMNAPRLMREVTGDFTMTVRVLGEFKPPVKSTNPKAIAYIGGGIVVWQDSDNYIFLGRAGINRNGKNGEFAAFEEREFGTRGAVNNRGIDAGGVYLRVERRNNRILGYTSKDGKDWSRLDPMETSYPATIKVGLYAINGCADPAIVKFEDFNFTEGKGSVKAKKK